MSLLKQLIDLDEWSEVLAKARSELPFLSSKITRIALNLDDTEVPTVPLSPLIPDFESQTVNHALITHPQDYRYLTITTMKLVLWSVRASNLLPAGIDQEIGRHQWALRHPLVSPGISRQATQFSRLVRWMSAFQTKAREGYS